MIAKVLLDEQTLRVLLEGKRIEGSLFAERVENKLVVRFNPYRRKKPNRHHDQTLLTLGHGWLRKSAKRYRLHLSIPDNLGERPKTKNDRIRKNKSADNFYQIKYHNILINLYRIYIDKNERKFTQNNYLIKFQVHFQNMYHLYNKANLNYIFEFYLIEYLIVYHNLLLI